jgi:hypothetical protein
MEEGRLYQAGPPVAFGVPRGVPVAMGGLPIGVRNAFGHVHIGGLPPTPIPEFGYAQPRVVFTTPLFR